MQNKVKILHYIPGFKYGGIESRMMDIVRKIDKDRFQLDFLILTDLDNPLIDEIISLGSNVHKIPLFNLKTLLSHYRGIKKIIDENDYDIVHCHSISIGFLLLRYAKSKNIKGRILHSRTSSFRGSSLVELRELMQKLSVYYANRYLAVSNVAGQWTFGDKIFKVIPNSINLEDFKFNQDSRQLIRNYYGISNEIIYGHVGRNTYAKNHDFLLKVFKEILILQPNAKLMLVGVSESDKNLYAHVKLLNIEDNVIFCGYQKNINMYYSAMDSLIFPSFYEGMPGTLIEAQTSGLKVYCSDIITKEINLTDNISFISLDKPPKLWADKIVSEVANSNTRNNYHKEIGKQGYTIERTAKLFEDLYMDILKNN